ncbi:MAG: phage major capsid protein [Oscillospiraceae bacterium]|nr:phage major capsid protein [Oscillospiraceae bacterium]
MRIAEIQARLAEINAALDTATGDALTALETEARSLMDELRSLQGEAQARQTLRQNIAEVGATVIESRAMPTTPAAPAAPAQQRTPEQIEDEETRSFAGFVRGTVTQMRTGEQNFNLSNNGALLPTSIARRIIETVRDMCPILQGADVYHVRGTLKIPVYGNANTSHNIAVGYSADFTELTADAGAFTSVDLTGYLVGALSLIGKSLLNSSDIDLTAFVVRKMAEAISVFVEKELLVGTSGKCQGALSTTNTLNAGSTTAITADNLIELQSKVKQVFQGNAVWTLNPDTFTVIKKLKDAQGRYLLQDDLTGAFPYRLLGKPVILSDSMPKIASAAKAVLYGDYRGLAVNIREDMSVEVLREKYATQHAIGIVGWMELDSKVADSQMLATLVMSAS